MKRLLLLLLFPLTAFGQPSGAPVSRAAITRQELLHHIRYLASDELSGRRTTLTRSILFIAFGAEESGLIGSNYYVRHPVIPLGQTVAMINMDMIGHLRQNELIVGGVGSTSLWEALLREQNDTRFDLNLRADGYGPSDHASFYNQGIPVLFFYTASG